MEIKLISVVIPMCNMAWVTDRCLEQLINLAADELDIIIIDNASDIPYTHTHRFVTVLRNDKNVGFWGSMLQGIAHAQHKIVMLMHNDVLIWEDYYDQIIEYYFSEDKQLALAGFFGGKGLGSNGGRGHPESNLTGKEWGQSWQHHSHFQDRSHPSVIFDSLCMIVDKEKLATIPHEDIPPHHYTDRLLCVRMLAAGYHMLTIGIAFDHGGSFTSTGSNTMNTFTEDYCKSKGLEMNQNWDYTLMLYGHEIFLKEFLALTGGREQIWVNERFEYHLV